MRSAVLALCLGTATAFAPATRVASRVAPVAAFEGDVGATPPLGLWDPLGLLDNADQERFDRLREVEQKHGRVSMLAVAGHLTTSAGFRLNGDITYEGDKFADIPSGLAALGSVPPFGLVQIFFFCGALEVRIREIEHST